MRTKTKPFLQREAVECGAASLGIILRYYGREESLIELREKCGVSRDGTSAGQILTVAQEYGLNAKAGKATIAFLETLDSPAIILWQFNHFLVVEGLDDKKAYLNDPAVGRRQVSREEFDKYYSGIVLLFEPSENFVKARKKRNFLLHLSKYLQHSQTAVALIFLAGFLLSILRLIIPAFSLVFVDQILVEGLQDWLRPLLLGMIMTLILQFITARMQYLFLRKLMIKLLVTMNSRFIWHILRLPIDFFAKRLTGDISSRAALNNETVQLLSSVADTLIDAVMVIFFAILMVFYSRLLASITIVSGVINVIALFLIRRFRIEATLAMSAEEGRLHGYLLNSLLGIETVKAGAYENYLFRRIAGIHARVTNQRQRLAIQTQTLSLLPTFLSTLSSALILILGGLQVMEGQMSIGMLVAFGSISSSFLTPLGKLLSFAGTLQELEANLERLDDVLDHPLDEDLMVTQAIESSINITDYQPLTGKVTLKNITFGYNPLQPPLIENFNLQIQPGSRIALVGKSGSGKSTIAQLVCGLYQPQSGEVLFDGIPRQRIPRSVLTKSLAMVAQDIFLFEGTIWENLTMWNPTIKESDVIRACQDANIHDFILTLPNGYQTQLLEKGVNLSGGQRQRLEIARALINNPQILVLDEATSSLDAETEHIIDSNLRRRGCACLVVAHRLSTIRDCDEIIVLRNGKVLERGNHQYLWEHGTYYRELLELKEVSLHENYEDKITQSLISQQIIATNDTYSQSIHDHVRFTLPNSNGHALSYYLQGNTPLILDQPDWIWFVKSGTIDIFYSEATDAILTGNRHYLFSVKSGELVFNSVDWKTSGKLLAVCFEPSELVKLEWQNLPNYWTVQDFDILDYLTNQWISRIKEAFTNYSKQSGTLNELMLSNKTPDLSNPHHLKLAATQYQIKVLTINQELCQQLHQILVKEKIESLHNLSSLKDYHQQSLGETINNFDALVRYNAKDTNPFQGFVDDPLLNAVGAVARVTKITITAPRHNPNQNQRNTTGSDNLPDAERIYLEEIVRNSRCRMREVQLTGDWWQNELGALLGWLTTENLPVALLPDKKHQYLVYHPQTQAKVPLTPQLAQGISPQAFVFYRPYPLKINNVWEIFRFNIQGYELDIIKAAVVGVIISLTGMITPQANKILVNSAIPDGDRLLLWQLGLGLLAVTLGSTLFNLVRNLISLRTGTGIETQLQLGIYDRLFRLSPKFFRQYSTGDLLVRIASINQIFSLIGGATGTTIFTSFFALLNLGLMFTYSQQLTFIVLIISVIIFIISLVSGLILVRFERQQEELAGKIQGFTVELINGISKLRMTAAEPMGFAVWGKKYQTELALNNRIFEFNDILSIINEGVSLLTSILIYWFVAQIIFKAQLEGTKPTLDIGTYIAFNSAMGVFLGGVTSLSNTITDVIGIIPLWERAKSIIQEPIEFNLNRSNPGKLQGRITLKNLVFAYPLPTASTQPSATTPTIIHDLSLEVKPGQFVAIVGPSGSGKSTLFRLLLGFEQPQQGEILYDGRNLAELDLEAVRQQLGVVLQDSRLMTGSIYDNISCDGLVEPEIAWEAARQASIAEDIAQMPMGMNTVVSEGGGNLSAGQRQRLLIARALIRRPKILLFDEATSALDNKAQAEVTASLEKLNVTRIVIAHRLSTIRNADRIYVVYQGRILQVGNFSQLIQQEGLFQQLVNRQLA
ncbi:NHLP family bacteriocin export ABC transporter peptidase/permease/ATPase subunit [Chrysosporum bergii ANA360D]|uniref:NHLP family bacteriocin export ABC transporter peptidase/permease/ATPase subunit n=1 Tax=Chrysosporum bergii ANA360D TaxID=617107 RepID=A0AA43KCS8_9CYAN|nr:NHLP family bacteriocin export ABC transporter peptidase/permease/ATPase subunit [Chrysosporum bergii]MDH6061500.1 NHLP family bacteriocin export ABC transporter peptidase/permease/ATPase subunit [Chrysosporum bergii ANA360D]